MKKYLLENISRTFEDSTLFFFAEGLTPGSEPEIAISENKNWPIT